MPTPVHYVRTKHVKDLAYKLGYRKQNVQIVAAETVTLHGLNWDGGSKSEYHAVNLDTLAMTSPDLGREHPWFNRYEGAKVQIPPNHAVIRTGIFLGQTAMMVIHVHPSNVPKLLGDYSNADA